MKQKLIPKFLTASKYFRYLNDPEFMARMLAKYGSVPGTNVNSGEEQNLRLQTLRKKKDQNTHTDRRTSDQKAKSEQQERNQQHDKVVNTVADALHGVGEGFMFAANPYVGGAYMLANGANRMLQGQYDWRTGMDLGFGLMPFGNQISRGFQYASEAIPEVVRRMPYTIQMQRMPWAGGLKTGLIPDKIPVIVKKSVDETIPLIPEGFEFVRRLALRTKDGTREVNIIKNLETGKSVILEDLGKTTNSIRQKPTQVDLAHHNGQKLTGNEPGFDDWALSRTPETDHFANLSHGLNNESLLPIMNREFESLPNGSRVDLGEIFSSDSSSNLLLYVRRNNKRIKLVLPKNPETVVTTNNYGTRGADSERIFNELLDKLLDLYGYSPTSVLRAVYNPSTNTLTVPKLSFIKLFKTGNKLLKYGTNIRKMGKW